MNIEQLKAEDHRRMTLWFLLLDGDYCLGEAMLQSCFEAKNKDITPRELSDAINWLEERGMVTKEIVQDTIFARLTEYGVTIAKGRPTRGVRDLRVSERAEIKAFLASR